ncbi:MAG: hypothetical protein K9J16_16330 [Melioribacteraceae bacterium]|nr:hypothetical protein [Melioribacteraceae bacterium]MCF8356327.1 hypothetical protein [Melioribacteraceae bacterium]MCF8395728.1 hypothetical protein [Melioribacteraceae bacterium]MCF8420879.1 hypothetical protein [Melioribacteraceae bacterium]
MKRKLFYVFSLLIILNTICYSGEKNKFRIENISLEEGVSHNTAFTIFQDSRGFIWFGTMFGLVRFDGVDYTIFNHNPNSENSISFDDVVTISEDRGGSIWIGTYGGGLNKLNPVTEKFERFTPHFFGVENKWSGNVWRIAFDKNDNVWLAADNYSLIKLDPSDKSYLFIKAPGRKVRYLSVYCDDDVNIIAGTTNGIFVLEKNSLIPVENSAGLTVTNITPYRDDKLLLSTESGLYTFNEGTKSIDKLGGEIGGKISGQNVGSVLRDSQNRFWVGTTNGLYFYDHANEDFQHFTPIRNDNLKISGNNVTAILEDRSGIIWIGNYMSGINKIFVNNQKFELYQKNIENKNSLSSNYVQAAVEDKDGYVWIGTRNGLNKFDHSEQSFKPVFKKQNNTNTLSSNFIKALAVDESNNLWIGTNDGLDILDPSRKKITYYSEELTSRSITALYIDSKNNLWVGTSYGINKINLQTMNVKKYLQSREGKNSLTGSYILSINESSSGEIWIGTFKGLNRLNTDTDSFKVYKQSASDSNSISNHYVYSFYEDVDNNLWFGTGGGLNILDRTTDTFSHITTIDGLPNMVAGSIIESNGSLYIGTHKGISKYNLREREFTNYDTRDGLQSNFFIQGSALKLSDGKILMGGINGFNIFDPADLGNNKYKPPVYITSIKKFDEEILNKNTGEIISIDYDENFVRFRFAALDYNNPGKIKYKYKLIGVDDEWVDAAERNYAGYTDLSPGKFTFIVKSTNSDGTWFENFATVELVVNPPFWQTWWFYFIVTFAAALAVFGAHRYKLKQEVFRAVEIEKVREEENEKVRRKAADDFHDELGHRLTKISLYTEIVKRSIIEKAPEVSEYVDKISEASGGLSSGVRDFIWNLDPQKDTLYEVIIRLKDFGDDLFDRTGIAFRVEGITPELNEHKLSMDWRRHITLIFKEAMNNILKYSKCENVTLVVDLHEPDIQIKLKDDGKGFDEENTVLGRGLNSMKLRAKSIKGNIEIFSNKESGTEIKFKGAV